MDVAGNRRVKTQALQLGINWMGREIVDVVGNRRVKTQALQLGIDWMGRGIGG